MNLFNKDKWIINNNVICKQKLVTGNGMVNTNNVSVFGDFSFFEW